MTPTLTPGSVVTALTATDVPVLVAQTVADTLDLTSAGVLAAVGIVDPPTCRAILLTLWGAGR